MITREDIVAEARTWIHTPWRHMGRVKGAGTDCCMFGLGVHEALELVPHQELVEVVTGPNQIERYPADFMLHSGQERVLPIVERFAHRIELPHDGALVLYKFGRVVSHVGIIDQWPRIIHAYRPGGMVEYGEGDRGEIGLMENGTSRIYGFYSAI